MKKCKCTTCKCGADATPTGSVLERKAEIAIYALERISGTSMSMVLNTGDGWTMCKQIAHEALNEIEYLGGTGSIRYNG